MKPQVWHAVARNWMFGVNALFRPPNGREAQKDDDHHDTRHFKGTKRRKSIKYRYCLSELRTARQCLFHSQLFSRKKEKPVSHIRIVVLLQLLYLRCHYRVPWRCAIVCSPPLRFIPFTQKGSNLLPNLSKRSAHPSVPPAEHRRQRIRTPLDANQTTENRTVLVHPLFGKQTPRHLSGQLFNRVLYDGGNGFAKLEFKT